MNIFQQSLWLRRAKLDSWSWQAFSLPHSEKILRLWLDIQSIQCELIKLAFFDWPKQCVLELNYLHTKKWHSVSLFSFPHISACVRVLVTAAESSRTTEISSMVKVSYQVNSKQQTGLEFSQQNRRDTVSLSSCFQVRVCQHLTFQRSHTIAEEQTGSCEPCLHVKQAYLKAF